MLVLLDCPHCAKAFSMRTLTRFKGDVSIFCPHCMKKMTANLVDGQIASVEIDPLQIRTDQQ